MTDWAAVRGAVKFRAPDFLKGWAFDPARPEARLQVEVLLDGRFVGLVTADGLREDLVAEGVGDGRHGFRLNLGTALGRATGKLVVRPVGSTIPLPGGEVKLAGVGRDGQVAAAGYLDSEAERAALAALPIESLAYGAARMNAQRLLARWTNRLRRERNAAAHDAAPVTLLGLAGLSGATRAAWALQSARNTAAHDLSVEALAALPEGGWCVFAAPGDLPHPSTAHLLAGANDADVVHWRRFVADAPAAGAQGVSQGRPAFDPATARHGALSDTTLAVRNAVLARAPADVLGPLAAGRIHPLIFWLAGQALRWTQHPEALTSSLGLPPGVDIAADLDALERLLFIEGDRLMLAERPATDAFPYVLWPRARPELTSVIVCFRDDVAATLRCLRSLARQRTTGAVELVLVDNQSDPASRQAVVAAAEGLFDQVCVVSYDAPFNHSAQNNLAAARARGEILVFANNDVTLTAEDTLEALAAWASQPGVGLVGCRLVDPVRGRSSLGLAYAPLSDDPFAPVLQEGETDAPWPVRAAAGATLALAAMRRDRFLGVGGLDAVRFPIGYNDVDLSLRATALGFTHLFLGHVGGEHVRGSSRTGDNEDAQAALARGLSAPSQRRFEQIEARRSDRRAPAASIAGPAARSQRPSLMVFLDLAQDYDVLAPILRALLARDRLDLRVVVTDWLETESPRTLAGLGAMGLSPQLFPRGKARKGEGPEVGDAAGLLTAAESSAGPHRAAHGLAKRFAAAGRRTFTLQHGLEMVGLTYRDAEYGPEVRFASETVFTWGSPNALPAWVAEETRAKCVEAGDPKAGLAHATAATPPRPDGPWRAWVGVFENLHWKRYDDAYRDAFLEQLAQAIAAAPDTLFLLKPHPAGRWSLANRDRLPAASNLVLADPGEPAWAHCTAADLIPGLDRVITTPSTVALDAARAGVPVAVLGLDQDVEAYAPLDILRYADDWPAFLTAPPAGPVANGQAFLRRVVGSGEGTTTVAAAVEAGLRVVVALPSA